MTREHMTARLNGEKIATAIAWPRNDVGGWEDCHVAALLAMTQGQPDGVCNDVGGGAMEWGDGGAKKIRIFAGL